MTFAFPYKAEREKPYLFWPRGALFSCLCTAVHSSLAVLSKEEMSFDFIENEFKAEGTCGLNTLDDCHGMLHFTFDLKIEITWLPKNEKKIFFLLSSQKANASSC